MALGKDKTKHIICQFVGHEDDCPKTCSKCAISIKKSGDTSLASNQLSDAIKHYKKAIFAEPRFAEAWCCLARTYSMKREYNNALSAFDKALSIDPVYGEAMFGKAKALHSIGESEAAMTLANEILNLYNDSSVQSFKSELKKSGVRDTAGIYTLQKAIDAITDKAYEIIVANNLLDEDGEIHTIQSIETKEDFANSIYSFCKKRYGAFGDEKVWSESLLAAYYGSAYVALMYYKTPSDFTDVDPFAYLSNNVNLEELDRNTEKLMGIRDDNNQSEKIWNIVYSLVTFSIPVLSGVEPASDIDAAVRDATENAYIIGMLLAMRYHDQQKASPKHNANNEIFKTGRFILYAKRSTPISIKDFYRHSPYFYSDDYDLIGFPIEIVDKGHPFVNKNGKFYFAAVNYRGPVEKEIMLEIVPAEGEDLQKWSYIASHRERDRSCIDLLIFDELKMWGILERTNDPNSDSGCILKNAILEYSDQKANELFNHSVRYDFSFEKDSASSDLHLKRYMGNDNYVVIPDRVNGHKVVSINSYAFSSNLEMERISIPNTIISIDEYAFKCEKLTEVVLPDSVKHLGYKAFSGKNLSSVKLGKETEIENIDRSGIYVAENNKYYTIIDGVFFSKDGKTLLTFSKKIRGSYHIPEGVENIKYWGLLEAQLDDLYFPRSIKHIGECVFQIRVNDTDISRLHFPSMHITFDDEAFGSYPSDIEIYAPEGSDAIAYAKKWNLPYVIEN